MAPLFSGGHGPPVDMKSPERRSGAISNTLGRKESIQIKCKRRHKSCSVPPLRTCPKMDGWRQLGNRSGRGLGQPKSTTTSWIQEMEPQETIFHAGNGLC
ncbi:unnamed protein product [Boreogadus saida]